MAALPAKQYDRTGVTHTPPSVRSRVTLPTPCVAAASVPKNSLAFRRTRMRVSAVDHSAARGPQVAETDGTPRYRKSKPPKGANGSGASNSRNTRPNGKTRKRGALRDTIQTGVSADEPNHPVPPASENDKETKGASAVGHNQDQPVVKTTMPTVIRADVSPDALADTYADMRPPIARSTAPMPKKPLGPRGARGALGSTLRMELTVQKNEGSEPRIQVRPTGLSHAELFDTAEEIVDGSADLQDGSTTLQEGPKRSRKPTQPGFAPAFPDPSARPLRGTQSTHNPDPRVFEHTQRRGSDIDPGSLPPRNSVPSMSTTGNRPRRPRRPGERTLIMTARNKKGGSKRDWVFVVLLVAALGLTASMFLSQQTPAEEVVDASAYEDDSQAQPDEQDPFAQTTLRPWKGQGQAQAAAQKQSDTNALTAREPAPSANTVQATELRTQPSGAEVLAGDAVVGSTPVRVARGSTDMVYVLRLAGHESKVVRVGPHSPASILVELGRLAPPPEAPAVDPAAAAAPSGND